MEVVAFSPAQMHLITLMSHIKSADALDQLRDQLADFYARQVDEEMEKLWESGEWNEQKLESLQNAHFRTPYK
jgi:capsule polysaccharide export protein KpsE/RkpR